MLALPLLFTAFALAITSLAGKDGPSSRIPDDQPPLRRVIKPLPDELVQQGTEKCVFFTREHIGGADDWDFVAGAWEFIPNRPAAGIVKRVEFTRSSWAATLALGDELRVDGPARNWVRLQVDDARRKYGYRPNLYHIDFRTWDVTFLGDKPFYGAVGGNRDVLLVSGDEGIVPWSVKTATAITGAPPFFKLLEHRGMDLWLVEQKSKGVREVWSYRPSTLEYVTRVPWFTAPWEASHKVIECAARKDGRAWSIVTLDGPRNDRSLNQEDEGGVNGSVWLADAGAKELESWPVRLHAMKGYGVDWKPLGIHLWFQDQQLCFQSEWKDEREQSIIRQWTVDLPTGGIRESVGEKRHEPFQGPDSEFIRIPEIFHPEPNDAYTSEKYLLASYFLKSKGLIKQMPRYADCRVGFTRDLRRFVWKTQPGNRSDGFGAKTDDIALPPPTILLFGDLDKETVVEVPCPPELVNDNAIEIEWVIVQ